MLFSEVEFTQPSIIEVDEMAFAISLFVAAARGKVSPPNRQSEITLNDAGQVLVDPVLIGARVSLGENERWASDEVPLACAVSVVWHHYERDARQQSICSRLVAFYSLMVRSRGISLNPGKNNSIVDLGSVTFSPAIIDAVASTPVSENGQFLDTTFRARLQNLADHGTETIEKLKNKTQMKPGPPRTSAAIPITNIVERLSTHLYAFQSCVAAPQANGPRFHVIEELCGKIAAVNGNTSLQALLSRALFAIRSDFPWIRSATASPHGMLEGLEAVQPTPDPEEVMQCELAILGSLIELLRSFLGNGITVQLLRSLWPLASLGSSHGNEELA